MHPATAPVQVLTMKYLFWQVKVAVYEPDISTAGEPEVGGGVQVATPVGGVPILLLHAMHAGVARVVSQ